MSIEPGNTYILVNAKSGTALDLSGTDGYTGMLHSYSSVMCLADRLGHVIVSGWERHGEDNQRACTCVIKAVG